MSVWFITGASRGLGAEIAKEALARGHQVVASARNADDIRAALPDAGDRLLAVALDVTDEAAARAAVAAATDAFGSVDVLVNNAGRGLLGAVEESTDAEVRAVYETNVFGLLAVTRAVTPVMRAARSGVILNISSIGAVQAAPAWGVYASTKYAIEGLSEALRDELAPLGIKVTIIQPGYFRTEFLESSSLQVTGAPIAEYTDGPAGQMRRYVLNGLSGSQQGDPAKAASAIADMVEKGVLPIRLPLGPDTVAAVTAKLDRARAELAAWHPVAMSPDHDDVAAR
jgi:NAD(P)-dependent dehydrogenase (short-subunit alcohol dehydrogenase family)